MPLYPASVLPPTLGFRRPASPPSSASDSKRQIEAKTTAILGTFYRLRHALNVKNPVRVYHQGYSPPQFPPVLLSLHIPSGSHVLLYRIIVFYRIYISD